MVRKKSRFFAIVEISQELPQQSCFSNLSSPDQQCDLFFGKMLDQIIE
jgi:hypothetical protein